MSLPDYDPRCDEPLCTLCKVKFCAPWKGTIYPKKYRKYCYTCADKRYKKPEQKRLQNRKTWAKYGKTRYRDGSKKMKPCILCGFIPKHHCQMDWDHINGIHFDHREENLQLLCANCHRLKTLTNGDFVSPTILIKENV